MKKVLFTILICSILLVVMTGCVKKKNESDEHSFYGKVLEVTPSYLIVEPNEDEEERRSSDKFRIDLKDDNTTYEVGTIVKITYVGMINESYPAQIGTTKIEIVEKIKTHQKYSKTIENVTIEINIPNEWKYEELPKDEENDFYKYALKLYKSQANQYAILYFDHEQAYFCGTLRKNENIILDNGLQAVVGYYEKHIEWNDISFFDVNPNIIFINYGLKGDEALEVLDFVKTINIK